MLSNIQDLFNSIFHKQPFIIILNVILLVCLFELIYQIYKYESKNRILYNFNKNVQENFKEKEISLKKEFDELYNKDGNFEDKNRLRKITKLLNDSGLKSRFPELTAEMFIIVVCALALLAGIVGYLASHMILIGIASPIMLVIAIYIILERKKNIINKKIEQEILKFADLLANMSRTEGNLTEMFGGTVQYLAEPLKTLVAQCYYEMKSTGNISKALAHFSDKANHKKLKEMISYLSICAEKDESYEAVIFETKESIRSYIAYQKEKNEIKKQGLVDLFMMAIGGVCIVVALSSIIPNTYVYLFHKTIGQVLCTITIVVFFLAVSLALKADSD